jgi:hypothetical protein
LIIALTPPINLPAFLPNLSSLPPAMIKQTIIVQKVFLGLPSLLPDLLSLIPIVLTLPTCLLLLMPVILFRLSTRLKPATAAPLCAPVDTLFP